MGVKFLEQGQRMAGSGPAAVQRASTLPGPGSSLYLIEAAVRQAGILLVLRTHIRGCEAVALAIHVLPKAQWCHLRVQETTYNRARRKSCQLCQPGPPNSDTWSDMSAGLSGQLDPIHY